MSTDDPFDVVQRLDGIDGPRPLPADLDDQLSSLLGLGDPVAALAAGADADSSARALPVDLRDRLEAGLAGPASGAGRRALPDDVRRRLLRVFSPGLSTGTGILRVAAVVVAVLLVAGGLAFAAQDRRDGRRATDLATQPDPGTRGAGGDQLPGIDDGDATVVGAGDDSGATETPTTAASPPTTKPTVKARTRPKRPVPPPAGDGLLVAYSSCDDLLGRTKAAALEAVGPYGLGGSGPAPRPEATADGRAGPSAAATAEASSGDTAEASTTNLQEAGVDEPDIIKSDGRRIVTLTDRTLRVSLDQAGNLTVAGALTLPDGAASGTLLVDGDRALVLGWTSTVVPGPQPAARPSGGAATTAAAYSRPQATIWTVGLGDPAAMAIESTLVLDGVISAARLVDGKVRIVLTSTTVGPDWVYPADGSEDAQQRALEENRRLVRESALEDWLPTYTLLRGTDPSTARHGRICACGDTLRPEEAFAGSSMMSVLTLDPQRPDQPPAGSAAVQGYAETVYASRTNLFVTTRSFAKRLDPATPTAVHRFDISAPDEATYRGSGEVRGFPLNQFSLSERSGHLRIATTDAAGGAGSSESFINVLAIRDDRLEPVGQVGNLGKGERIFAVRFLDDVGYVVTFRQTDPLYTVDLSDPANPRVRGELKIPGFSSYLHPVDDGRILGVGQSATDAGRTTGAQVSSFDVGSLDQPREVATIGYGSGSSTEVQQDHHAFLYWAPVRRAMVPVQRYEYENNASKFTSWLSVLAVPEDGRISEAGRVTHDGRPTESSPNRQDRTVIRRSFVVGNVLYTLSASGILASDLRTLADRSWLAFPPGG